MRLSLTKLAPLALAALLLLPVVASAQTIGSAYNKDPDVQVWSLTIPSGDSISYYFVIPDDAETIVARIDTFTTAGGIAIEAAVDSSTVTNQYVLTTFQPLKTFAAVLDSVASTTGGFVLDLTDKLKGCKAARFHIGYNSAVSTAEAETIWVFIRRRRR